MLQYVTINIDGALIRAVKGTSVLDTAIEYGVCIPHLCHVSYLSDFGGCRLCIVEHVVNGRANVTASCTLNVQEGMVIRSNSERIKKLRRNLAELLVAQAPNSRRQLLTSALGQAPPTSSASCCAPLLLTMSTNT